MVQFSNSEEVNAMQTSQRWEGKMRKTAQFT